MTNAKIAAHMVLPPLPETDWVLHMPAQHHEHEWTSSKEGYTAEQMEAYAQAAIESLLRVVAPPVPEPDLNSLHCALRLMSDIEQRPASKAGTLQYKASMAANILREFLKAKPTPTEATHTQPASEPIARADALNTLCKMLHSGEEVEGDDGLAMMVPMDLWNEAQEAIESLVGEDDATPQLAAKPAQAEPRPFTPTEVVDQKPGFVSHKAEPVARDGQAEFNRAIDFAVEQGSEAATFLRCWREGDTSEWPEFAALAASPTQPRPQPLTDDLIRSMCKQGWVFDTVKQWVRIIEAHHGITAQEPTK